MTRAETATEMAAHRVRLPVLRCSWVTQCFLHWPYPPEAVRRLLPQDLEVDEYAGSAWVGLTPFVMTDLRPHPLPALPGLPRFPETNLRTYVRRPGGRRGLWFFSLDVTNPLMLGAQAVGAPYRLARLHVTFAGDRVEYTGRRRLADASYRLVVRCGERRTRPTELDIWLTSRWRAYTRRLGTLWEVPVEHEPWPLAGATVESLAENLRDAAGLPPCDEEPLAHYSPGVRGVRLGCARPAG
ncbi:YqjF family protein [Streptomyces sp. QHH-9511]|uniref:YqjF family protein n=1 Tax=Streptomyces sp. QHH-9511 TaxID=2684468 RepID=UPI002FCD4AB4